MDTVSAQPGRQKKSVDARFEQLYAQLNEGQRRAVETLEGPVMVMAGPGTGKTQTLAMRIANILKQTQMDPHNILCLTFTESGVVAMRQRLVSIIGTPAYYVRIHTFHSFCNDIIAEYPEKFAKAREWQVLTDVEGVQLMQDIIDTLPATSPIKPFGDPYLFLRDIRSAVRDLKQEDIQPEQFAEILRGIEAFTENTAEDLQTFYKLTPKHRTDVACEELFVSLQNQAKEQNLSPSLQFVLAHIYETYQKRSHAADSAGEQSKVRTKFKGDLKKWIDAMVRDLPKHKDIQNIYLKYQEELETRGRYDYEDMILMTVRAWQEDADLLARYQEEFQYILVDEYQDTNGAQNEVVSLLGSFDTSPNIFVVGDDKQSIYRFQGASMNNMLSFYERYKEDIFVVSLRDNYRSQAAVLKASDGLIVHNEESLTKYIPGIETELFPAAGLPERSLELHEFESEEGEEHYVVERIKQLLEEGTDPSEIAILVRYHRDSQRILRLMRSEGIPVRLEAGENVLEDVAVQQFLTLLSYINDTDRDDVLADILQYSFWNFDALEVLKIIHFGYRNHKHLFDIVTSPDILQEIGISNVDQYVAFGTRIATWRQDIVNETLQDFLHAVLQESGWLDALTESEESIVTLKKLAAVLGAAKEFNRADSHASLTDFLQNIQLLQRYNIALQVQPWQVADNAVRLMTAHKAKGLEFEHVFVTRMNDKHWGNTREVSKVRLPHGLVRYDMVVAQENNEDERRLFYVAMTRAKHGVVLTRSVHTGSGRPTMPSAFLEELPAEVLERASHDQQDDGRALEVIKTQLKPLPGANMADVQMWIQSVLSSYVMSVTHLNNYLECPRKFYVKNLLHVPSARTTHQAMGTAVHAALDDFFRSFTGGGEIAPVQYLLDRFSYHLDKEVLTDVERRDAREQGQVDLSAYYEHYKDDFCGHTIGEYSFRSHGVNVDGIQLTGLVDKVELVNPEKDIQSDGTWRPGAQVNIVDYKTGNPDTGLSKIRPGKDYHRQLVFYKLLCDESPRFAYEMASAEIDFVHPSEKKGFVKRKVEISKEEVDELKDTIKQAWKEISDLAFLKDDAGCGECDVCA